MLPPGYGLLCDCCTLRSISCLSCRLPARANRNRKVVRGSMTLKTVIRSGPKDVRTYGGQVNALSGILALAVLFSLQFSLGCGGSGTSGGSQPPPPPSNPVPAIVSLSPNSATAGAAAFTLTI